MDGSEDKGSTKNAKVLHSIYKTYGIDSIEFYNYSLSYFRYLVMHYNFGKYDHDIMMDCYNKLLGLVKYGYTKKNGEKVPPCYDETKSNIATYIHGIVRNMVTDVNYAKKKYVGDPELELSRFTNDPAQTEESVFNDIAKQCCLEYSSYEDACSMIESLDIKNPVKRSFIWHKLRLNLN